ncbi:serine/threonine protein kinase-like protein [Pseudomassariella vexata]|uniref:Serine/threonine protein kinase-like protein n=1 Tax=Pseudomassariella vexata TaxID=1141098 RepID=A0A1Y2DB34_9PEZI|nr:serine/threonine protein kinase-like protein [Pseudomassariella vexata]ORY55875.1 serine/threonine protein kinase-like protein [Pseudomassariella vexata]
MGEDFCSEERTEPFSQSEINMRLQKSIRVEEELASAESDTVPLDKLVIDEQHHQQGIRILVRPLTRSRSVSPGSDNCEWLALRAEVATRNGPQQPSTKVLAVTQTSKDINFSLRIPGETGVDETRPPLWCELYYDPASDNQILLNRSDVPITLASVSDQGDDSQSPSFIHPIKVVPGITKELSPGTWRIRVYGTPIIDFRVLAKRPASLCVPVQEVSDLTSIADSIDPLNSSIKRSFSDDTEMDPAQKRLRTTEREKREDVDDGVIMFYPVTTGEPLVFPLPHASKAKEVAIPHGHALLQIQKDETVAIPGGCELDQYQVTKRNQIATTAASSVFTAEHSDVPDGVITVKVLKTRRPNEAKPQDNHKNVIRQADIWLREYRSQEDLQHESIVKLYGGDARYLSLYMEHIDGKDLAARGVWRDGATDVFVGNRNDAIRILRDIASALNYVHQRRRVHNDIKPANILYSPDRGAVLCDFGLSTRTHDSATNGGTPYYVPPEFVGNKLRGTPSDVWALGVTMLYVLKRIAFPDARGRQGHPKQLYWMIAELNRRSHHSSKAKGPTAVDQMQQWLSEVTEARAKLNPKDKLHVLVSQMLTPQPNQRITMAKVMTELSLPQWTGV